MKHLIIYSLIILACLSCKNEQQDISIFIEQHTPQTAFAVEHAAELFQLTPWRKAAKKSDANIIVSIATADQLPEVEAEGFAISKEEKVQIIGKDAIGAMYGIFEVAEQLSFGKKLIQIEEKKVSPSLKNRIIKFNLPWSSYRKGKALDVHLETCRDTTFWKSFLDQMAVNRFNVLSLWNLHPFIDMIKSEKYPEASPYTEVELAERKQFWNKLFAMAKARGIQTYIVNWNIFVSEEFANAHDIANYSKNGGFWGDADNSALIEDYTRECVRQVIDEYPDLTGLGLTLGERMGGMTSIERRDWINRTIIAGMGMAKRKAKLLYRAPLSAGKTSHGTTDKSTEVMTREVLDTLTVPEEVIISFKYNWSHGHSSDQLFIVHGGELTDTYWNPIPDNYSILWTIRNEDFFTLRWAKPDFVRSFLKNNLSDSYRNGCIIGSECYIPANDYFSNDFEEKPFTYAFERQWLWYSIWGRLLYDNNTTDQLFAEQLNKKFNISYGNDLLKTWKTASDYYHRFASFYKGTWDATLYAEAFAATVRAKGVDKKGTHIIGMEAMGMQPALDTINYVNISEFTLRKGENLDTRITPIALVEILNKNADQILKDLGNYRANGEMSTALDIELTDLEALAHLQKFFAKRIEATLLLAEHILLKESLQEEQIKIHLNASIEHWKKIILLKEKYNKQVIPYMFDENLDYNVYLEDLIEERESFQEIEFFWEHDLS